MTIYSGFSHLKWWFSIVMLVYQRVYDFWGSGNCMWTAFCWIHPVNGKPPIWIICINLHGDSTSRRLNQQIAIAGSTLVTNSYFEIFCVMSIQQLKMLCPYEILLASKIQRDQFMTWDRTHGIQAWLPSRASSESTGWRLDNWIDCGPNS